MVPLCSRYLPSLEELKRPRFDQLPTPIANSKPRRLGRHMTLGWCLWHHSIQRFSMVIFADYFCQIEFWHVKNVCLHRFFRLLLWRTVFFSDMFAYVWSFAPVVTYQKFWLRFWKPSFVVRCLDHGDRVTWPHCRLLWKKRPDFCWAYKFINHALFYVHPSHIFAPADPTYCEHQMARKTLWLVDFKIKFAEWLPGMKMKRTIQLGHLGTQRGSDHQQTTSCW